MTRQKLIYWSPVYVIAVVFGSLSLRTVSVAFVVPALICSFVAIATSLFVKKTLLSKGLFVIGNTISTLLSGLFLVLLFLAFLPEPKQERLYRTSVMTAQIDVKILMGELDLILLAAQAANREVDPCFELCSLNQTNRYVSSEREDFFVNSNQAFWMDETYMPEKIAVAKRIFNPMTEKKEYIGISKRREIKKLTSMRGETLCRAVDYVGVVVNDNDSVDVKSLPGEQ